MSKKIKKCYDNDIKLYVDIIQELRTSYRLTLLRYKEFYRLKDYKKFDYLKYKNNKRNELNNIMKRLRKSLNIISIIDFVDLK